MFDCTRLTVIVLTGLAFGLVAAPESQAWSNKGENACNMYARYLKQACYADTYDDYMVHRADCVYVTSEER